MWRLKVCLARVVGRQCFRAGNNLQWSASVPVTTQRAYITKGYGDINRTLFLGKSVINMEDDDFEYYANFPSPETLQDKSTNESENPAIILLGWGGGSDRHLSKYSDIYNSRGYATLRYIYPARFVFTLNPLDAVQSHAVKLVEAIQDMGLEEQPLIFHAFSNAGSVMYYAMSRHLRSICDSSVKIYGFIYDSGPAPVHFWSRVRVTATLTPGGVIKRYGIAFLLTVHQYITGFFKSLLLFRNFKSWNGWNATWDALANEKATWPQLFLFSKADKLCQYQYIEKFAKKRKEKGVDVTTVLWDDSPHVGHLLLHRVTYINQVLQFVQKCLEKGQKK